MKFGLSGYVQNHCHTKFRARKPLNCFKLQGSERPEVMKFLTFDYNGIRTSLPF